MPTINSLKAEFNVPEEGSSHRKLEFFWDLENWLLFLRATRIGTWFSVDRTYKAWLIIMVLALVLLAIRFMTRNVYGAGSDKWDELRGRD